MNPLKVFGLIGYPVTHSLSPKMHNAAFRALKINAEYRLFELSLQELEGFFGSLSEKNIFGLNVTVPYKEKVMGFLNTVSPQARLIGAVNTIKVRGKLLHGFNTDGSGFIRHLKDELGFDPAGTHVLMLGAGGAARAIAVYLCKEKPASLQVYDVDESKRAGLVRHLQTHFPHLTVEGARAVEAFNFGRAGLLINATPVGMHAHDPCLLKEEMLHKNMWVYDIIYNPAKTPLLSLAEKVGARYSNGLGMLLYQGMDAFSIWTGKKAPLKVMKEALEQTG